MTRTTRPARPQPVAPIPDNSPDRNAPRPPDDGRLDPIEALETVQRKLVELEALLLAAVTFGETSQLADQPGDPRRVRLNRFHAMLSVSYDFALSLRDETTRMVDRVYGRLVTKHGDSSGDDDEGT